MLFSREDFFLNIFTNAAKKAIEVLSNVLGSDIGGFTFNDGGIVLLLFLEYKISLIPLHKAQEFFLFS